MSNKSRVVHSQGRQIIYSVNKFMKAEQEGQSAISVKERVAQATGVGLSTVKRICKEAEANPEGFTLNYIIHV